MQRPVASRRIRLVSVRRWATGRAEVSSIVTTFFTARASGAVGYLGFTTAAGTLLAALSMREHADVAQRDGAAKDD